MQVAVLIGSATPPGRTHAVADALAERFAAHGMQANLVDLRDVVFEPADGRPLDAHDTTIVRAVRSLADAAAVVVVSPVYRATYPGVLKNLLDITPLDALCDKVVGLAVVGAAPQHYLGVDLALRAVLAWFGAISAPTSVYLTAPDFDDRKVPSEKAREQLDALAGSVVTLTRAVAGKALRPSPLAARSAG